MVQRSRDAVVRTYLLVLVFVTLPPLALGFSNGPVQWEWLRDVLRVLGTPAKVNPFGVLSTLFQARIVPNAAGSAPSSWSTLSPLLVTAAAFTVVTLAWAMISIRRVYRKSMGVASGAPRRPLLRRFRPLAQRPMLWKELFAASAALQLGTIGRIAALLLFVGATAPAYYLFLHEMGRGRRAGVDFNELLAASLSIVTLLECAALAVVAIRAAGSITAEKERDSWLTLVSTALTPQEIIRAKVAGSIYAALVALPIGIWWLLLVIVTPGYLIILPMLAFSFLCVAWAVATIGVWFSSWCTTSIRAMAGTMGLCVFLGGGYLLCCIPFFQGSGQEGILALAACIPFLLVMPTVLWMEGIQSNVSNADVNTTFAFLLGLSGYLVLGVAMMHANINQFDRRVGRPMRSRAILRAASAPSRIASKQFTRRRSADDVTSETGCRPYLCGNVGRV